MCFILRYVCQVELGDGSNASLVDVTASRTTNVGRPMFAVALINLVCTYLRILLLLKEWHDVAFILRLFRCMSEFVS